MREERAKCERRLAMLAARQHGVVSLAQLEAGGVDKSAVTRRLRTGQLHRVHRGVYAVGHRRLGNEGRWMAALLALGHGTVLSHRSAAELWELLRPRGRIVHVTVPDSGGRAQRSGLRIHRSPSLTDSATTIRNGMAVTTPARTIADLRRVATPQEVRQAVRQADARGYPLGEVEVDRTRSELEYLFLRVCRRHRLPRPEVNVRIGRFEVDFLWPRARVIVETDGYRYHRGARAFEADRDRDLELGRLGYTLRRFSYRQVTERPREVAAALRPLLS
jgi:very-short-patch-repair endonuclease